MNIDKVKFLVYANNVTRGLDLESLTFRPGKEISKTKNFLKPTRYAFWKGNPGTKVRKSLGTIFIMVAAKNLWKNFRRNLFPLIRKRHHAKRFAMSIPEDSGFDQPSC